jgi:RloB-like protein
MGDFQNTRLKATSIQRQTDSRPLRKFILIVCEGAKTEPYYFEGFRVNADVKVVIKGGAGNTLSVVEQAQDLSAEDDYDSVWCVFDRDSFPNGNFSNAISSAKSRGFKVAYTNEAFELWYLLHFSYQITAHSRHDYAKMLTKRLGKKYVKNDRDIYEILADKQKTAIRNAKTLCLEYTLHNPDQDNPYTTVHLLVEELNSNLVP